MNIGYGVSIGKGDRAANGLQYLKDWIYTPISVDVDGNTKYVLHYIKDLATLLELSKFNLNGNFDKVSTLCVGMYDIREMQYNIVTPKKKEIVDERDPDILERGWYQ